MTSGYWLRSGVAEIGAVARFGSIPGIGKRATAAIFPGIFLKVMPPNVPPILSAKSKSWRLRSNRKTFFLIGCRPRVFTAACRPRRISSSAFTPQGHFAVQDLQFKHLAMMVSNIALIGSLPFKTASMSANLPRATDDSLVVSL
ncbi:hypothetical protein SDC9_177632 [bioreactor metagenome]|uniref:Uncharacterized protein n=1 Tax=bioreactor metagenome TaxID=1076179 RepID=A0A645H1G5_9ZZZZ